jgi:flagellar export protein FliJ
MANLNALIRLHKHELDERRRVLAAIYQELAVLEQQRRALQRSFEAEKEAACTTETMHYTFAAYAETVTKQILEIDRQEAAVQKRIEKAKENLMESFSELKKYEMTQEERDRLAEEERKFKDGQAMDAIGLENYRRSQADRS